MKERFQGRSTEAEPGKLSRRQFVSGIALAAGAPALLGGAPFLKTASRTDGRPGRVAIIASEVRKYSHAQHFIDRFLEGYGWQGRHHRPPLELASLYVDQVPRNDLALERSRRHGVRIYPSIAESLTLGGSELAVDGVLLIVEHGDYPTNEKGQKLYPRHRFFKQVVEVFEQSGRAVPVFNDKHLSTDWAEAVEMVEDSRRLQFAFLAGSSLPVTWRMPALEVPLLTPMVESVCVCYGGVDSYDFHGFETAQCMSERRAGGETGIRSVQALKGDRLWERLSQREGTSRLMLAALARSQTVAGPEGYPCWVPTLDWIRTRCPDATGWFVEHLDGFATSLFTLNGLVLDFTYAGLTKRGEVHSCLMHLPMPPRMTTLADFFNPLVHHIEQTVLNRQTPYPVERTLLTTGMTLAGVESLFQKQAPIATPIMRVPYPVGEDSTFWRA